MYNGVSFCQLWPLLFLLLWNLTCHAATVGSYDIYIIMRIAAKMVFSYNLIPSVGSIYIIHSLLMKKKMLKRDTVQKDTVVSWRVLWLWLKSYWLWCIVGYREANRPCRGSPGPAPLAARGRVSTAPYRTIVLCLSPLTKDRTPGLYTPDCSKL